MARRRPRPAALMEDLIEQVLLRFPPDNPASLVRAALVSKQWCRLIADGGFRRRFRELHGAAPPMLGLICNVPWGGNQGSNARLVRTSSCPLPHHADRRGWRALDSRHGRVLLCSQRGVDDGRRYNPLMDAFVVWSPVTGDHLELPPLPLSLDSFNSTVLCAGAGGGRVACDHLDDACHRGRFLVVLVGMCPYHLRRYQNDELLIYVYSSESGAWSEPAIAEHPADYMDLLPAALVGNALYFVFLFITNRILKYDLDTQETCVIRMPRGSHGRTILMTTAQGKLGFARADEFKLYLWSMEVGAQGDAVWTQDRVIELKNLLPADALLTPPDVVGCVHGRGVVLIGTGDGFFTVGPKLNQVTKVGEGIPCKKDDDVHTGYGHRFFIVVPYTSFYFPALEQSLLQRNQVLKYQVHDVN